MKYLSLFSGIGGFELGIQQAYEQLCNADGSEERGIQEDKEGNEGQGLQSSEGQNTSSKKRPTGKCSTNRINERPLCIGYSEIDKYAIQIYEKHFNHKNYGDITKIITSELPDFDLLVGGFPCQAFSIAGKRKGFDDTRGTLFFDIARILRAKQPRLFLLENVKGLLSHDNGNTFKTIISTLDELGYDLQWQVLNSKNFGVPQNRERVFIIGHLGRCCGRQVFPFRGSDSEDTRNIGEDLSYTIDANYAKGTNTLEKGRRQLIQLNNPTHSNDRVYNPEGISPTLNTMQGGNRQPKIYDDYNQNWRKDDVTCTLTPNTGSKAERNGQKLFDGVKIRRLTPKECERLQGFPDNWTAGISDTQRYKCLGNAVTVNVIQAIMEKILCNQ